MLMGKANPFALEDKADAGGGGPRNQRTPKPGRSETPRKKKSDKEIAAEKAEKEYQFPSFNHPPPTTLNQKHPADIKLRREM